MLGPLTYGAIASSGGSASASTLLNGLVNYWKLDEESDGSGAVTRVDSRNDEDLTDINTVANGTGFGGLTVADFESGNSEYLSAARTNSLSIGGGRSWSVAIWTNLETLGSRVLVSKASANAGNREFELDYIASSTNRFMATVGDGGTTKAITATTPVITIGTDYLVVLWYDASIKTGYIQVNNGTVYSTVFTTGPLRTPGSWGVGSWGGGGGAYWDGLAAHCYHWDRILTEDERTELYNDGAPLVLDPGKIFTMVSSQELYSGSGATDWLGRPTLIDDGSKWIMVYRQADTHSEDLAAVFHIRFSTDEGATWTAADTFTDATAVTNFPVEGSGSFSAMNAALIQAPNNDLLFLMLEQSGSTSGGTRQWRSTDGGASWTDEGTINSDTTLKGPRDYVIIGTDIYIACWADPASDNAAPFQSVLYKSTDNGATWAKVSDITSTTDDTDEIAIEHLGDGELVTIIRGTGGAYRRVSTDYGATWGTLTGMSTWLDNFEAPRLKLLNGVLYLIGRDADDETSVTYSKDDGATWSNLYHPDTTTYSDAGYCDMLQRANGDWYMLSYGGTTGTASIYEYVFALDTP